MDQQLESHAFTADRGDDAVRLDLVLQRYTRGRLATSRRKLQAAIEAGQVRVNGEVVTRTAMRVTAGDHIEASLPAPRRREAPRPEAMDLEVLFEDAHLLACNKLPGLVVHPSYKHAGGTLFNGLLWHVRESGARPRLLQRLDKDTSGVVLVSKSATAHAAMVRAMRAGTMRKEYLAIVRGVPRPAAGIISLNLHRDPADRRRVAVAADDAGGKLSVTRYETMSHSSRLSLLRCELVTGRMHQIRVHLAARGWAIVGDGVYGEPWDPASAGFHADIPAFPRQALHAWRVWLPHPVTGEPLAVLAPIPDDMTRLMEHAGLSHP